MEIRPILSALLRSKTGAVLIAAQVALTLAIIANALHVVEERLATAARPTGADEQGLFQLYYMAVGEVDDPAAMKQRDLEILRAIPGVIAAASISQVPLGRSGWNMAFTADPKNDATSASFYFGGAAMVDALGVTLGEGRAFTEDDVVEIDSQRARPEAEVAMVTRHLAQQLWPTEGSVVGNTIYLGSGADAKPMRVIGVLDMLMNPWGQVSDEAYKAVLIPVNHLTSSAQYVVRAEPGQRARAMAAAEEQLSALRDDRILLSNRTMDELRTERYRNERTGAGLLIAVSIGLLLITGSGIVGVASLWVNQRRKQIGVRRALGARRIDILRYFVTENLLITTGGTVLGVALAIVLNQLLITRLELAPLPLRYVAACMVCLWALGIAAVLGPAWRAAAVPPAVATRSA